MHGKVAASGELRKHVTDASLQWLAIVTIIVAATGTALSVRRPMPAEPLAN